MKLYIDEVFFCPRTMRYHKPDDAKNHLSGYESEEEFWEKIGWIVRNSTSFQIKDSKFKGSIDFDKSVKKMMKKEAAAIIAANRVISTKGRPMVKSESCRKTTTCTQTPKGRRDNHIYLMKNKRNGFYKIGKSIKPRIRERTLQAEEPEVEMVFSAPHPDRKERELHERYSEKRLRGEWFSLTNHDVRIIVAELKKCS